MLQKTFLWFDQGLAHIHWNQNHFRTISHWIIIYDSLLDNHFILDWPADLHGECDCQSHLSTKQLKWNWSYILKNRGLKNTLQHGPVSISPTRRNEGIHYHVNWAVVSINLLLNIRSMFLGPPCEESWTIYYQVVIRHCLNCHICHWWKKFFSLLNFSKLNQHSILNSRFHCKIIQVLYPEVYHLFTKLFLCLKMGVSKFWALRLSVKVKEQSPTQPMDKSKIFVKDL